MATRIARKLELARGPMKSPRDSAPGRLRVSFSQETQRRNSNREWLEGVAQFVFRRFGVVDAQLEVALVSDATIAQVNRDYLGHIGPTDVLTFNYGASPDCPTGEFGRKGVPRRVVGELVISVETAEREALRRGHATRSELALYLVHGVLHLLGYDDRRPAQARTMHAMEDEILEDFGCGNVFNAELPAGRSRSKRSGGRRTLIPHRRKPIPRRKPSNG